MRGPKTGDIRRGGVVGCDDIDVDAHFKKQASQLFDVIAMPEAQRCRPKDIARNAGCFFAWFRKMPHDLEKGFIRAEVIGYDDYVQYNGEQGAKDAGKWRLEGKEYIMQDGDVVHFRFNV